MVVSRAVELGPALVILSNMDYQHKVVLPSLVCGTVLAPLLLSP